MNILPIFNSHLLQINLTVEQYLSHPFSWRQSDPYFKQLPTYLLARCPFCASEYLEKVDTYSIQHLRPNRAGESVMNLDAGVKRCPHFALAESVFRAPVYPAHEIWGRPTELKIAGNLVENGLCKAVIHALPICRVEAQAFVPYYMTFMISYFSERPAQEIRDIELRFVIDYQGGVGEDAAVLMIVPLPCRERDFPTWSNLLYYVASGQLYWVDVSDPTLPIRTHDVNAFPYGDVPARRIYPPARSV